MTKSWQDRGEVLDSDDEELSIRCESGSPERSRKKPRLEEDVTNSRNHERLAEESSTVAQNVQHEEEDEEEDWLQPVVPTTVATTYGGKARVSRVLNRSSTPAEEYNDNGNNNENSSVTLQATPHPGQGEEKIDPISELKSSQSSESENLPDVQQILGGNLRKSNYQVTDHATSNSTPLSSPLSERDVSPPAPFAAFHFPRLGGAAAMDPALGHREENDDSDDESSVIEKLPDDPTSLPPGRRSLRARKENQLHPYMFEQAQYQKQCRERGLRPIRYVATELPAAETQDVSLTGDESDSQKKYHESNSSPERPSSELGNQPSPNVRPQLTSDIVPSGDQDNTSDDELPDLPILFNRHVSAVIQNGTKRRKVSHVYHAPKPAASQRIGTSHSEHHDEFSVPPSPPPTSSDSAVAREGRPSTAGFVIPRGLTPAPLPTPQISSDVRIGPTGIQEDFSEAELPPRRSRPSTVSGPRPQPISGDTSTESSESEVEPGVDEGRLVRERRRIKGVLPASWLKIDFRAQQKQASPSPSKRRRLSSSSPPRTMPLKGVAQRVNTSRSGPSRRADISNISDDGSDPDSPRASPSPPGKTQQQPRFERNRGTVAPSDFVDDERMEIDWVDPMLAGSSRNRLTQTKSKKRQPRITDALAAARNAPMGFSEERGASRQFGRGTSRRKKPKTKSTEHRVPRKPSAPRLSILDAPDQLDAPNEATPQFVRLARRRARAQADHGRHSPTRKHIRLATKNDTEDATIMLRAWREGTVAPRQTPAFRNDVDVLDVAIDDTRDTRYAPNVRQLLPLTEIHHNRQQKLPPPLRKEDTDRRNNTRPVPVIRRPRMRQMRLHLDERADESDVRQTNQVQVNPSISEPAAVRTNRRFRVESQSLRYRGAQLESLENDFDREHCTAAFERRMHHLAQKVARPRHRYGVTDFQLARFLDDSDAIPSAAEQRKPQPERSAPQTALPHRPRKRRPQRVDAEAREYRQPSEPVPDVFETFDRFEEEEGLASPALQDLGLFGTRYATDFDILPLSLGTYFHETTFIGSGDFAATLTFARRDLDKATGRIRIHVEGDVLEWGAWTEDVASGLARIPRAVLGALQSLEDEARVTEARETASLVLSNIDYLLRSVVRYFTRCLAFLDPVDRRTCVQSLHRFIEDLLEVISDHEINGSGCREILPRCLQYTAVLAHQALSLCDHALVQKDIKVRSHELATRASKRLACHVFPSHFKDLRSFYEDNRHATKRESGMRDRETAMCIVVVLRHTLNDTFWNIVYHSFNVEMSKPNSVYSFDKVWCDLFTILPALEMDENGILRPGSRFISTREDWSLPKRLVERVFELYFSTCSIPGSTVNDYVRATLLRGDRLVNRWGWWRCESILGTIFDFFARRGLAQLQKEESRGSPRFLEELDHQPSLEVQSEDKSFHIFLKMLAEGLLGMQKHNIYPDKKIGGIAWRFIPNHGRTYRKDAEVRQADLDALRNHHDLLCTLYYASPPGHRLRVELIQNLVDHTSSHREACRLNVRAWANLASFQMSTSETLERLEPFALWFREMLTTTVSQYRLARTEVEQELALAKAQGKPAVSQDLVEGTITRNQRQIAATLVDSLAAIKRAIRSSKTLTNAVCLLDGSAFWQVFELFDPATRHLHGMLDEGLEVAKAAVEFQRRFATAVVSQQESDDSQGYGDSSALQELATAQTQGEATDRSIADVLHAPLGHVVSNVFGADTTAEEALLTKCIDVWTRLAQLMVSGSKRTWASYISDYGPDAWNQLRDTEQRRKYTPYFLARIVESTSVDLAETGILTSWLKSLVEREAMLKFQHVLTSALLNGHCGERLLVNLPFTRHTSSHYNISMHELRQRRVALISSVLSNMRDNVEDVMHERPQALQGVRAMYADILHQMMQTMKSNYQEVQISRTEEVAGSQAQGAYVEFVQQVVSCLQQYIVDICPVDRFFTDSTAFPLPAEDPTYVVGRLRAYVSRLAESRKRKELAVFIQTVSERAAVDGQQTYLVDQLVAAMAGVLELGNSRTPSLRHVLLTAIFPPYFENALSTACSWIVAVPMLQACGKAGAELLYCVKLEDHDSVRAIVETIGTLLCSMSQPINVVLTHRGLLSLPHIQKTLAVIFDTSRQCLACVGYLKRATDLAGSPAALLAEFDKYATMLETSLDGSNEIDLLDPPSCTSNLPCRWPDTRKFAQKQVQTKFNNDWHAHSGQYYVRRGRESVEVGVALEGEKAERLHLLQALKRFRESFEKIFSGRGSVQQPLHDGCGVGGVIV